MQWEEYMRAMGAAPAGAGMMAPEGQGQVRMGDVVCTREIDATQCTH